MTVAAGHLGRPRPQLGAPCKSRLLPPLPPPVHIVPTNYGPAPILSGLEQPPNIGVVTVNPGLSPVHQRATHPPSLLHAEVRSPTLLCSLFVQGYSNPSSCRLNLHTKDQCKDHQLCGYKSRVHSKKPHTPAQIHVSLALILFLQV